MNVHDALNEAVADRLAANRASARDTVPAPVGDHVVKRDCIRGEEFLAPLDEDELRYATKLEGAERFTKHQAELIAKRMGGDWRSHGPI